MEDKKGKEKKKREEEEGNGNRGRERRKIEKSWYFESCEKNKYIKKWNSSAFLSFLVGFVHCS